MVLIVVPIIAFLAVLLTRTQFGQAVRASADNPNAASLAGISVKEVSTQVWVLAGRARRSLRRASSAPLASVQAGSVGDSLGPSLLLRALAAAMVGRLQSFPLAMAGGIAIGIVETLIKLNPDDEGSTRLFVFLLLLVLVMTRGRSDARARAAGRWPASVAQRPRELGGLPFARWVDPERRVRDVPRRASSVPYLVTHRPTATSTRCVLIFMMVALSATVLTGWAGQLSLGQFAFVGIGAYATGYYARSFRTGRGADRHAVGRRDRRGHRHTCAAAQGPEPGDHHARLPVGVHRSGSSPKVG